MRNMFPCHEFIIKNNHVLLVPFSQPMDCHLGPLLLKCFNFNRRLDKQSHPLFNVGWNYLYIPKLQRCNMRTPKTHIMVTICCISLLWGMPHCPFVCCRWFTVLYIFWADSRFAPSQWETALFCNDASHWLGTNLESALHFVTSDHAVTWLYLVPVH